MRLLSFLASCFVWNYGLGMTYVVVPLYAHAIGLGATEIATLFSLPAIVQAGVNLVGGAVSDRIGASRIMLMSAALMSCAALLFLSARGFAAMFSGQLAMVICRAVYWPATWSLASELPGERSAHMARLNATTNTGQIAGTGSCGVVLAGFGFEATFLTFAAIGVFAAALALRAPRTRRAAPAAATSVFGHFLPLLRHPMIAYAILAAYLAALPFSLSASFFPLLLKQFGYGADASGVLIALRAVGSVIAGLVAARFIGTSPGRAWPVGAGSAVVITLVLLPEMPAAASVAALMLLIGCGAGVMTLYVQISASESSGAAQRGTAMALAGVGWSISHLTTPLVVGFVADRWALGAGFQVLGAVATLAVLALALLGPRVMRAARRDGASGGR